MVPVRWLGATYLVVVAIYFLAPFEGSAQSAFGNTLLTLAPAAAFCAALSAWRRAARGARLPWLLIALASASGLAGQLIWNVYELVLHEPVPFPSASYFLFMLFHPLLLTGILVSLRSGAVRRGHFELTTDGAVAWSVITLALLRLLFEPLRRAAPWMTAADQGYIIGGQIVVHGALVAAGALVVWRDSVLPPRAVAALVAATLANSAANFMSLARLDPDPGRAGDYFDLVWLAGWALIACAGAAGAERGSEAWAGTRANDAARVIRRAVLPTSVVIFAILAFDLAARGGVRLPTFIALGISALLLAIRAGQAVDAAEREQTERSELERTRALVELGQTMTAARGLDGALTSVCEWARRLLVARRRVDRDA